MKTFTQFIFIISFFILGSSFFALCNAQVPMTHFFASDTAICDSVYNENFTDRSTNNPTSWKWYFSGATPDTCTLQNPIGIQYKGYGCYTVKLAVKNNNGSDSLTDSNYICLDAPPQITVTGLRACQTEKGNIDTIKASGGTQYHWNDGSTTSYDTVRPLVGFTLSVTVYNGACYKDTVLAFVFDTMPRFVLKGYSTICLGDSSAIYAVPIPGSALGCSFLWSTGSTADSLAIDTNIPGSYNYYVIVTNKYGTCPSDSLGITIKIQDCTGIENYNEPLNKVEIFPNPNSGQFTLSLSNVNIACSIEIYNVLGEKVYSQSKIQTSTFNIDINNQPNGVYLYRILSQNDDLLREGKIVIQK